ARAPSTALAIAPGVAASDIYVSCGLDCLQTVPPRYPDTCQPSPGLSRQNPTAEDAISKAIRMNTILKSGTVIGPLPAMAERRLALMATPMLCDNRWPSANMLVALDISTSGTSE